MEAMVFLIERLYVWVVARVWPRGCSSSKGSDRDAEGEDFRARPRRGKARARCGRAALFMPAPQSAALSPDHAKNSCPANHIRAGGSLTRCFQLRPPFDAVASSSSSSVISPHSIHPHTPHIPQHQHINMDMHRAAVLLDAAAAYLGSASWPHR